ncbi:hypothetical protein ABBQ38_014015 [Trebouxia sp. C0009 RCD-2024]
MASHCGHVKLGPQLVQVACRHVPSAALIKHRQSTLCDRFRLPQRQQSWSAGGCMHQSSLSNKRRKLTVHAEGSQEHASSREAEVLQALSQIIDPDFGMDIVQCGFVKDLSINNQSGHVKFRLELTTPACPIKDEFERKAHSVVAALEWVEGVEVTMDAVPPRPIRSEQDRPQGLRSVAHVIAVSSCKGGVGKSTTAVNLAYTLAQMGAKVGILDADIYGPSLPTMVKPDPPVLQMDPETRAIRPPEFEGVKVVSFGFAGQGSAIMRGPMVSGVVTQLLTTTDWGELDYLVVDFPPGTGDIQLTLCQSVAFSAAVIVTTPQKLAFIDVAKGIRMFARLAVPCVAVVENMSYFEVDGVRHLPFGAGSGDRIVRDFGLPNLVRFPIIADLSAAGDGGRPLVVSDPLGAVAQQFMVLGAAVVQEVAKLKLKPRNSVRYDAGRQALVVDLEGHNFLLHPALVRRNDTSAASIDEWTGEKLSKSDNVPDDIQPDTVAPLGNYAVQILWQDGFNQVAPFDLLNSLERMHEDSWQQPMLQAQPEIASTTAAQQILSMAGRQ